MLTAFVHFFQKVWHTRGVKVLALSHGTGGGAPAPVAEGANIPEGLRTEGKINLGEELRNCRCVVREVKTWKLGIQSQYTGPGKD